MEPLKAISFLLFALSLTDAAKWTYERGAATGPANWGNVSAECDERRQSPINFVHEDTISVSWKPFKFKGYNTSTGSIPRINNIGHTAMMDLDGFHSVSEGGLPTEYQALQVHFHWGKTDAVGSEHTIDGKQFPLEMHIVHYAYIRFNGSDIDAVMSGDPDALAVLGVLFEIGEEDNEELAEIIKGLTEITAEGQAYDFQESVSLIDLLPEDKSSFYRYNGSLTTPDCHQIVTWTVFTETVPISQSQMEQFRALTEGSGSEVHSIGDAFRPVQPVYDRDVFYNGAVLTTIPSLVLVMGLIMIHLIP
ncbi:carbonic anhydrase 1-like [Apostichopus japonicus]|uniref:carbonic anhydrase 1-like n=1 Tax=Stichopus japonicus TaxID=307972 RepID=UPI003AB1F38D